MNNLPNEELEIKLAFIERHIEEQDRVIYGLRQDITKIQAELKRMNDRLADSSTDGNDFPTDVKPPHY